MHKHVIPITVFVLVAIGLGVFVSCRRAAHEVAQRDDRGTTPDTMKHAIQQLLDATPAGEKGGFVIFGGYRDLDYVQFALESNGLLLNWPTMQTDGPERLPAFREQLEQRDFRLIAAVDDGVPISEQIDRLRPGQFMILDDGLYAQTGKDASEILDLTIALLRDVFGVTDLERVQIDLAPNG